MILSKDINTFLSDFDFTESIVERVNWDENLLDLLVVVLYDMDRHEGKEESRKLTIRFKNCLEANFAMPKCFDNIPKDELNNYIYSWYTITNFAIENDDEVIKASVKTIDNDPRWLTVKCKELWVEGEA